MKKEDKIEKLQKIVDNKSVSENVRQAAQKTIDNLKLTMNNEKGKKKRGRPAKGLKALLKDEPKNTSVPTGDELLEKLKNKKSTKKMKKDSGFKEITFIDSDDNEVMVHVESDGLVTSIYTYKESRIFNSDQWETGKNPLFVYAPKNKYRSILTKLKKDFYISGEDSEEDEDLEEDRKLVSKMYAKNEDMKELKSALEKVKEKSKTRKNKPKSRIKNQWYKDLKLPLRYYSGNIVDANDKTVIKANRENDNPLSPAGRDELLKEIVKIFNEKYFK